jgi:hypothetical protein
MRLFRISRHVCYQNFRKWPTNYRVWVITILLIMLTHNFTSEIVDFAAKQNMDVSPWIFPFLFTQKYIKLLFFFPLILLFSDAPFMDENQPYIITRSGRTPWSIGQISYLVIATVLYFLFLIFISIVINLPYIHFSMEWGKVLGTLANTNAAVEIQLKTVISPSTIHYFTPLQAMWFSFLLLWLSGVFLGLVIYVMNCLTNTRIVGLLVASFFLVLDATILGRPDLYRFSPVSWSNLNRIDIEGISQMPSISYIYTGYILLIGGLVITAFLVNRKQSISVLQSV